MGNGEQNLGRLGQSVRWQSINVAVQVILQIVFLRVLGAFLAPGDWGLMGIALAIVGIIEIFAQIGVGPSLVQKKDLNDGHIAAAFWLSTALGITFTAAVYIAAPWIAGLYGDPELVPVLRWIGLSFTLAALALVPRSLLLRRMDFRSLFFSSLSAMLIANWVIGIGMAMAGYGIWSYAVALIVQNTLLGLNYWWRARVRIRGGMAWASLRPLLRYGAGSTLFNVFNYGATKLDVLVLGYILPGTAQSRMANTGLYERGTYVMGLPITMLGKLSDSVLFSGMSSVQSDRTALERIFLSGVYYVMWLVVPGVVLLELYSREVVLLLLGPALLGSVPIVQILMLGVLVRGLVKVCDAVVRAVDAVWAAAVIKGGFMLWVGAAAWWFAGDGLESVAWAVVAGTAVQCALMLWLTSKRVGVRPGRILRKAIPGMVVGVLAGIGGWAGYALPEAWGVGRLALGGAGALLLVLIGAWCVPWMFAQGEHALLSDIAHRLPAGRLKSRWHRER
jgi:O-antigen/teichoic acid export membrane protein